MKDTSLIALYRSTQKNLPLHLLQT